jgi:hypothetical protein
MWNPNIPAALLLLAMMLALFAKEIRGYVFERRFFSPERWRLERIGRALQRRAR